MSSDFIPYRLDCSRGVEFDDVRAACTQQKWVIAIRSQNGVVYLDRADVLRLQDFLNVLKLERRSGNDRRGPQLRKGLNCICEPAGAFLKRPYGVVCPVHGSKDSPK